MGIDGKRLKALREQRGLYLQNVADVLGVTRQAYMKYESGETKNPRQLEKLAKFFNVTTDYLLGNDNSAQKKEARPAAEKLKQELQLDAQDMELIKAFVQLSPEQRKKGIDFLKALSTNVVDIMPSAQTAAAPPDVGRPDGLTDEEWSIVQMLRLEEEESSASLSNVSAKRA